MSTTQSQDATAPKPSLELRRLQSFAGRQGEGFSLTLVIDGVRAAEVHNAADGGVYRWRWLESGRGAPAVRAARAKWDAYVASLPPEGVADGSAFQPDADYALAALVDEHEEAKRLKAKLRRACRTKTLFRLPSHGPREWLEVARPFTPALKAAIEARYPGVALTFINELAGRACP